MRTMIVPVDGSENAANAARYAADMALAIDAEIHLLYVVTITSLPMEVPLGFVFSDMENAGNIILEKLFTELRERTREQVKCVTLLEIGNIVFKIEEVCRRLHPFAVIMGAPEGSFMRSFAGSPAIDAARSLPYPVLVIPKGAEFHRIRRIVLACEAGKDPDKMPLGVSFLKELKELFDSRFDIVHVGTGSAIQEDRQVIVLNKWQKALGGVTPGLHFLPGPEMLESVEKFLGEQHSDWLMVFPGKHGLLSFHASRTKPLLLHCTVPVISICEAAVASHADREASHLL